MTFEEYLTQKKIDSSSFKLNESQKYKELELEFLELHPNSFTFQKLNLINFIRRKYPIKIEEVKPPESTPIKQEDIPSSPKPSGPARPVFRKK